MVRIIFLFLLSPMSVFAQTSASLPSLRDASKESGLNVAHIARADKQYIVESMSGGVGLIDCDNDGKLDIIQANGSTIENLRQGGDPMITLYRQGEGFKFTDVSQSAGLTRKGWGMGVAVADYDNDGLPDIYVTGYGGNALYHSLGNCKFEDVTEKAGVQGGGFSTGAAWADYDRDGRVDLFVSRYVHFDINHLPTFGGDEKNCSFKGVRVQCGPWGMQGESDLLYHNRGDGTFEEVAKKAGVDDAAHLFGLGAVWGDYDDDGWPDLYVANDAGPNYLYRNKRDGTFEETGMLAGVALSGDGLQQGSMGVDWGDYRRDGKIGVFVTNFTEQSDTLYSNLGKGEFADVSVPAKLEQASYLNVGWGTGFVDFSNSGWLDIFVANGHVYPQMDKIEHAARYREPLQLFRNRGDGTFDDVSRVLSGIADASWRGAAFGDINNDGSVDVVVLDMDGPPLLLLNQGGDHNHRVLFRMIGTKSNAMAIGAKATVTTGKIVQTGEVRAGGSYLSNNDPRLHFGLAAENKMDKVTIRWPSGREESLQDLPADFIYTVTEGKGVTGKIALPPPQ